MKTWQLVVAASLLGAGSVAQAGLMRYTSAFDGAALVFDDDYGADGLTWVADANLFKTQYDADNTVVNQIVTAVPTITDSWGITYNVVPSDFNTSNGWMTWLWWAAMAWAEWLGVIEYGGANDWRLWSPLNSDGSGPCSQFNCVDSELGHLFYVEGGLMALDSILKDPPGILDNYFTNLQSYVYWSGVQRISDGRIWYFHNANGSQNVGFAESPVYGWAVRPEKVAAAPLPSTGVLLTPGLTGIAWVRRKE